MQPDQYYEPDKYYEDFIAVYICISHVKFEPIVN